MGVQHCIELNNRSLSSDCNELLDPWAGGWLMVGAIQWGAGQCCLIMTLICDGKYGHAVRERGNINPETHGKAERV